MPRVYVGNRFGLEIENTSAGWLLSAEGGQAATEVVQERMAQGHPARKHPGIVKFEDITISCGTGMSRQFYQWLEASFPDYEHLRRNGAIIVADYDLNEVSRLTFINSLISEIGFPALDASSKEAAKMTVKIVPERTDMSFARPGKLKGANDNRRQKLWQVSNFRLDIDQMPCRRVSKVEALTIKQKVIENPLGDELYYQRQATAIDYPNLVITLPEADAEPWYKWHKSFVIDGNSGPGQEKTGTLTYLASDQKTVLFGIHFSNLGIIKFTPDKLDSGSDKLRMVKIEMYFETLKFDYNDQSHWA